MKNNIKMSIITMILFMVSCNPSNNIMNHFSFSDLSLVFLIIILLIIIVPLAPIFPNRPNARIIEEMSMPENVEYLVEVKNIFGIWMDPGIIGGNKFSNMDDANKWYEFYKQGSDKAKKNNHKIKHIKMLRNIRRIVEFISGFNRIHCSLYSYGYKLPFVEYGYFRKYGFKSLNDGFGYHNCTISGIY